ncbi:MAG: serine/threonine protein phosphatase, partial [Candidatus Heimdallarchaeota archaeon]|nr:serine/threonine protein phosphatase [Candidatus Heimdallarchaeota archaeon]
ILAVGDVHGDLNSVNFAWNLQEELNIDQITFMGDFIDRGAKQIETLNRLCELLIQEPTKVILLRGNHEDLSVCSRYGFRQRIKDHAMLDLWELIGQVFASLPIFLHQENFAMYVHGGISEFEYGGFDFTQITKSGVMVENNLSTLQSLWNDPIEAYTIRSDSKVEFSNSPRGAGVKCYSKVAVKAALDKYNLKYLIRAHIVLQTGFKWYNQYVLSLFSANSGAYKNIKRAYAECRRAEEIKLHFNS